MSNPPGTTVLTGRWVDWSRGSTFGNQITLPNTSANILIAFIAVFIAFVGSLVWLIIAWSFHQLRILRSRGPENGLYHQTQALLCNPLSPISFALSILKAAYAWRKHGVKKSVWAACGLALTALIIFGLFASGGLLLSLIARTGDVLLINTDCKIFLNNINATTVETVGPAAYWQFTQAAQEWGLQELAESSSYAQVCYPSVSSTSNLSVNTQAPASDCNFYVKPYINYTTDYSTPCPFQQEMCRGSGVSFDTGYINTHDDLGRNAEPQDRLEFRRKTTCAPIVTDGFWSNGFVDTPIGNAAVYYYGGSTNSNNFLEMGVNFSQPATQNYTFIYPESSFNSKDKPYTIYQQNTFQTNQEGQVAFHPDERLTTSGTILTLMFLANRVYYYEPLEDPWFNATTPMDGPLSAFLHQPLFYSESPGSTIACQEELHLCNPNLDGNNCVLWNLTSSEIFGEGPAALNLNAAQNNTVQFLYHAVVNSLLGILVDSFGDSILLASNSLSKHNIGLSLPISPGQWILELQNMQSTTLAAMQRSSYTQAVPPPPIIQNYLEPLDNEDAACHSQKFKSSDYTSFSVVGLGLIFAFGGLMMIISGLFTVVVPYIQNHFTNDNRYQVHWHANQILRLQRVAYEDHGLGTWKRQIAEPKSYIPTTETAEKFGVFTDIVKGAKDSSYYGPPRSLSGLLRSPFLRKSPSGESDETAYVKYSDGISHPVTVLENSYTTSPMTQRTRQPWHVQLGRSKRASKRHSVGATTLGPMNVDNESIDPMTIPSDLTLDSLPLSSDAELTRYMSQSSHHGQVRLQPSFDLDTIPQYPSPRSSEEHSHPFAGRPRRGSVRTDDGEDTTLLQTL